MITLAQRLRDQVRGAIAALREPFGVREVLHAIGPQASTGSEQYRLVWKAVKELEAAGQIAGEIGTLPLDTGRKRAARGTVYHRTRSFQQTTPDPEAQISAGAFLNQLALTWGARRNADAAAE